MTPPSSGVQVPRPWIPGERLTVRGQAPADRADGDLKVGVLALQGDVLEHLRALERVGAGACRVRNSEQLAMVDALVLPGGESTTIGRLIERSGLLEPLRGRIAEGMPVLATCAGLILLSDELDQDFEQVLIGGLGVLTRRNAFGRQRESFDARIEVKGIDGGPMDVSFIRAPRVEQVLADDVEVLAAVDEWPVVVRRGALLAAAFHPELTGDDRLHAYFLDLVAAGPPERHR